MIFSWRDTGIPGPADPEEGWRNGHAPSRQQLIEAGWGDGVDQPAQ